MHCFNWCFEMIVFCSKVAKLNRALQWHRLLLWSTNRLIQVQYIGLTTFEPQLEIQRKNVVDTKLHERCEEFIQNFILSQ